MPFLCVLKLGWSFQALFIYIIGVYNKKTLANKTLQTNAGVMLAQYRVSFGETEWIHTELLSVTSMYPHLWRRA